MAPESRITHTEITTPTDKTILMTRTFDAPRKNVFDAWTNTRYVSQWMLGPGWTMPEHEIDLRPGGKWRFKYRKDDNEEMEMHGVYKEVHSPDRLVSTENWGGDWPESINEVELGDKDGKTPLRMTIHYPSKEARDRAMATGMQEGADQSFDKLERLLRTMR